MKTVHVEVARSTSHVKDEIHEKFQQIELKIHKKRKEWLDIVKLWLKNYTGEIKYSKRVKTSAVLIPLIVNKQNELDVLLTVRHRNVSLHEGEVCLPGGKWERQDDGFIETALRETYEEIGLESDNVEIMLEFIPMAILRRTKKYVVYPVIGLVKENFYAKLNKTEVLDVFTVPFKDFVSKNPELFGEENTPCIRKNGIVTNEIYTVIGFTYAILVLAASMWYREPPSQQFKNYKYASSIVDYFNLFPSKL